MALAIPFFLGIATIFQATLNKKIALNLGLLQTGLITNIVALVLCLILYLLVAKFPALFPQVFQIQANYTFKIWYLIPGLLGIMVVLGLPYAMTELGAVKVTIFLITAQILSSFFWDTYIEHLPVNTYKVIGSILAFISVIIMSLK